jgi:hypothetical protein
MPQKIITDKRISGCARCDLDVEGGSLRKNQY